MGSFGSYPAALGLLGSYPDEPFLPLGSYPEPFLNAELGSFGSDPDDLRPLGSSLEPFLDAALGSYPAELGSFASY